MNKVPIFSYILCKIPIFSYILASRIPIFLFFWPFLLLDALNLTWLWLESKCLFLWLEWSYLADDYQWYFFFFFGFRVSKLNNWQNPKQIKDGQVVKEEEIC